MSLSRRRFVQTVGAGAAGLWITGRGREAGLFDLGLEAQLNAQSGSPVILASTMTHFELVKTGFEEQVGAVAHDWSLVYGLATALLANLIFRRD